MTTTEEARAVRASNPFDAAMARAHALYVESGGALHPHPRRFELVAEADAIIERTCARPQLTPRKREPDTYCFRCGVPVPGGLFIGNSRHKGRGFSWVNVDDMTWRTQGAHVCTGSQIGPLFERPAAERDIIERRAVHELELDDAMENLTTEDLVSHLGGEMADLEDAIKHATGPHKAHLESALDQAIADAEQLLETHAPRQLVLAL